MSDGWKRTEDAIASVRIQRCNDVISKIIGGDPAKMPRVAVCLSGGGWRAMTSACALFDALSTPLAPTETVAGVGGVKLMDTVSYASGLSGGSWALFTTLAGGDYNPFHQPIDPRVTPQPHPWFFGPNHCFDENVHLYEGLAHMVSRDLVDRACYRSAAQQRVGFLSAKAGADTTIAAALTTDKLGTTLVERWGNFIANDILNFTDVRSGAAPNPCTTGLIAPNDSDASPPSTEPLAEGAGSAAAASAKARDAAIVAQNRQNPSRNLHLSNLRSPVERGDLPFIVCSAIANRPKSDSDPRPSPQTRSYDWVEFTPWFSRNPAQKTTIANSDDLGGYFEGPRTGSISQLSVHHLMAVCGSAFACDVACALPAGVSSLVQKHVNVSSEPILGGGITDIVEMTTDAATQGIGAPLGQCRDAGIDFNVPLPPLLPEAGRTFDIIIVHDAGAGSKNAFELQRAVDLGYLTLMPGGASPLEPYRPGECVRVFRGSQGYPTVIYFLGLTERGTHQIVQSANALRQDVRKLRENALRYLLPVILAELRVAKARIAHTAPPSAAELQRAVSVVRSSQTRRAILLDPEDEDEEDEASTTVNNNSSLATPMASNGSLAGPAVPSGVNPLAEGLVVNAMMAGKVQDSWDAFLVLERALMDSVPVSKRHHCITVLQERAVKMFLLPENELAALPPVSSVIDAADLVDIFIEFGILQKTPTIVLPGRLQDANLSSGWADYLAASALVSAHQNAVDAGLRIISRDGIPLACPRDTLESLPLTFPQRRDSKLWNLVFVGFQKFGQLGTLRQLVTHVVATHVSQAARTLKLEDMEVEMSRVAEVLVEAFEELGGHNTAVQPLFAAVCSTVATPANVSGCHSFTASDAMLALAVATASRGRSPYLLRIAVGLTPHFSSPLCHEQNNSERAACILLDAALRNPSSNVKRELQAAVVEAFKLPSCGPEFVTLVRACMFCLPFALKDVITTHLDDREAVKLILDTNDRHAWSHHEANRMACMLEVWTNGAATNLFRDFVVDTCVNQYQKYWVFLAPRVKEVRVPSTATPEKAAEAVAFADRCKRLQLINVPGNLAHGVRSKLGELETRLLSRKDAVAAKLTDVVGAVGDKAAAAKAIAVGKVAGLFGRFGK